LDKRDVLKGFFEIVGENADVIDTPPMDENVKIAFQENDFMMKNAVLCKR
jgi:hypothetical protein